MADRVTIGDIARIASVSRMTVSRVINNEKGVGKETRQRIETIIEEVDYRPSQIARSLATQKTLTLGLVVQDISNPFFSGIARGIDQIARQEGYSVLLCNTEEDSANEKEILQVLEEKRVDGVLLCSSRLKREDLRNILPRFPSAVLVNRLLGEEDCAELVDSVIIDEDAGGSMATGHLLSRGHQKIAFLAGPQASFGSQGRRRGYESTIQGAGIAVESEMIYPCEPTVEGGYAGTMHMLASYPEITAIFAYNDLVAVGVLQACEEMDLSVPKDVALVGYDDIRLAALVTPSLTTCRIPREEFGKIAGRLILDRIHGKSEECQIIVVHPELIIRASAP